MTEVIRKGVVREDSLPCPGALFIIRKMLLLEKCVYGTVEGDMCNALTVSLWVEQPVSGSDHPSLLPWSRSFSDSWCLMTPSSFASSESWKLTTLPELLIIVYTDSFSVCAWAHEHKCHQMLVESGNNLQESILSCHQVGPRDRTQVISKCTLYLLSHLASP